MIRYSDHSNTIGDILNAFPHMDFQEAYEYSITLGCQYVSVPERDPNVDTSIFGED